MSVDPVGGREAEIELRCSEDEEARNPQTVWVAFARGEFYGHDLPPGPPSFVGVYTTKDEALKHCRPPGDDRWVEQRTVGE